MVWGVVQCLAQTVNGPLSLAFDPPVKCGHAGQDPWCLILVRSGHTHTRKRFFMEMQVVQDASRHINNHHIGCNVPDMKPLALCKLYSYSSTISVRLEIFNSCLDWFLPHYWWKTVQHKRGIGTWYRHIIMTRNVAPKLHSQPLWFHLTFSRTLAMRVPTCSKDCGGYLSLPRFCST